MRFIHFRYRGCKATGYFWCKCVGVFGLCEDVLVVGIELGLVASPTKLSFYIVWACNNSYAC